MRLHNLLAVVLLSLAAASAPPPPGSKPADLGEGLARGWGDGIDWKTLPDGLAAAKGADKPVMLLIWKTWCGACKALRPKFAASPEIAAEAANVVAVNVVDDEEPSGSEYSPDGGYIPRILFLRPDGTLMRDITNPANADQYSFFHSDPSSIAGAMRSAAARVAAARFTQSSADAAGHAGADL